jgi:predicted DNA-binding transcriptional regulator YafY
VRVGGTRPDGRIDVEIAGAHIDALAGQIGGFGGAVEVLEPAELREELARIGAELCECYGVQAGSRP